MTRRIRRCVIGWMIALGACQTAAAVGNTAAAFDSANKLYEQGKFTEAASSYETLLQRGVLSPALYFNLGNARFKSGEIGRALAAYREAEQMAPRDPDVRANLQYLRKQIQGPTLETGWLQGWLGRVTSNEWGLLASAAFWVCLLLLAWIQFRPQWKPSLRALIWLSGLGAFGMTACLGMQWYLASTQVAIVTTEDAVVRNGPLDEAKSAFTVHDGAELKILDSKDDWLQVTTDNRRVGWLKRAQVTIAPPLGSVKE